ncbi:MAG: DUF938 domain-containing protein [Gammaproteobacteria bacterium]|nr:DUF938 domain-containing protein [Gammaproteobacteria bacterium]
MVSLTIPFSAACERNKDPILDVLQPHFEGLTRVLEIGSGTAQHAVYFARACPHLRWQTSDQAEHIQGIEAQLSNAAVSNVLPPLTLNVSQADWVGDTTPYDAVYTANTLHIMDQQHVEAFFAGLPKVTAENGFLFVYGPFKYGGEFTTPSNAAFDQTLRARGVGSALRDFDWVDGLAREQGFALLADHAMPANNQCVIWQRTA